MTLCDDCVVEACEISIETHTSGVKCFKCKKKFDYYDKTLLIYVRSEIEHEIFFCQDCTTAVLAKLILRL